MTFKLRMTAFQWSQEENNRVSVWFSSHRRSILRALSDEKLLKLRQPLMATWVKKHLSSSAGSRHDPGLLGLKELQQLCFNSLSRKGKCHHHLLGRKTEISQKHVFLL